MKKSNRRDALKKIVAGTAPPQSLLLLVPLP
jgi:hypothetical protein